MRKFLLTLLVSGMLVFSAQAQNTFGKGDMVLNLGLGLGSTLYSGSHYTNRTPPISASFEVGVKDQLFDEKSSLGIGGYLGYTGAKWDYQGWGWNYTSIIIGPRGILHYQLLDKLDSYTGLLLAYNVVSSKTFGSSGMWNNYSASASGLTFSWFLGGRYYFNNNIAGLLELGYGVSYLNLGVAFRL